MATPTDKKCIVTKNGAMSCLFVESTGEPHVATPLLLYSLSAKDGLAPRRKPSDMVSRETKLHHVKVSVKHMYISP